jgi:ubiquinone/menaquinone biosynthesis C-methylase UbiE
MNPAREAGSGTQGLTQFQLQGDAAERYERWAVPFVVGPWVPGLLDLAGLRGGERVLDVATGTGVVARLAARRVAPGGAVTGVDLNEGMLEVARRLPLPPGLTVDWRQGSALALPFSDGAFDVVLCQQGLQFFPDRLKALREMRRVLTSVGRVALSVWTGPSPYFVAQREGLARHVSTEAATSSAAAFSLGDADEVRGLLETAGFRNVVVDHVQMTLRFPPPTEFLLRHLSALPAAELVAAASEEARAALVAHMEEATREYIDGYGLAVPQEVNVATGACEPMP